jgi:hypothetical protein
VTAIAEWIQDTYCQLTNLNLRALWIGFTDDGLLQRPVSLAPLFEALMANTSLTNLTLSENYLEDEDMIKLNSALLTRPSKILNHLDVADNPFGEAGAKDLEKLLRQLKSVVSVHFENDIWAPYQCAEALKFRAQINLVEQKLRVNSAVQPEMHLWPRAFAKVQENFDSGKSIIFYLLRSTMGPHGKELSMQIATHHSHKSM